MALNKLAQIWYGYGPSKQTEEAHIALWLDHWNQEYLSEAN